MSKSRVAIVVDSTATLPEELVKKYDFRVIPQCLNWQGQTYYDGIDITPNEFYRRLPEANELPTTSQPSAGEFFEFFKQVAETAESIVAVLISEHLSGTLASALAAREMMENYPLEIVDSRSASMGLGFIAIAVAEAVESGLDHVEAAQVGRALVPKMRVLFVVDTLEYLHKGGRIGGASRLLGSALSIKPLLFLDDGRIDTLMKVRTKRKAVQQAIDYVAQEVSGQGKVRAAVIHGAARKEAEQFRTALADKINTTDIMLAELGPVLGAHTGPGLVGVAYYSEGN